MPYLPLRRDFFKATYIPHLPLDLDVLTMYINHNIEAFYSLVRAGLWEKDVQLLKSENIDFKYIFQLAQEQSVVGLVAAGLEHITDMRLPKDVSLSFAGEALQLEQRNQAMNSFIEILFRKMQEAGISMVLVKGQGVAQCYERPLWRECGDVDFLLDQENYRKALSYLKPIAERVEEEDEYCRHIGMTINSWVVELHGSLHTELSNKIDRQLDGIQEIMFLNRDVRIWKDGDASVCLPSGNIDAIFIFTHFLKHFYKGGLGIRQICDWCRLLWSYSDSINVSLLKKRLSDMKLMTEWKAFAAYAVDYLGVSDTVMPLYDSSFRWKRKAYDINNFILMSGNMGHNRDMSYFCKYPYIIRKLFSFGYRIGDTFRNSKLFPLDSFRFFFNISFHGVISTFKGNRFRR